MRLETGNHPIRSGGQVLVDQLLIHGADCAYCVPGESYLEVLDALYDMRDRFQLYNARHEAGAANMAEAYGKLTGKPGLCLVTRGPGACHAAIGVHIAYQDSTPMILLVGQVDRQTVDREAFQEIDYRGMFGGVAKWAAQINEPERIPEYMARAFHVATSGRPGPVVLALPEDVLTETVAVADAPAYAPIAADISPDTLNKIRAILETAQRPLLLLGGSGWSDQAADQITRFAEHNDIPVACSFRRQDLCDNRSPVYVGDFGTSSSRQLRERLRQADVLLVIGARLGEMTTHAYSDLAIPAPAQRLIHTYPDSAEIGKVFTPELGIVCSPKNIAGALADCRWHTDAHWAAWREKARQDYLDDTQAQPDEDELNVAEALVALRDELPRDTIVTLDAGNHTGWAQRFLRFGRPGRLIGSTCGSMGYAVPAAVSASLLHPDRLVLGFVGDGGFMMSGAEIATAVQHGAKPILLLTNNRTYGTIRMHQERHHPERVSGTDLINPDFTGMARAMGAFAATVTRTEDLKPALEQAIAAGRPAVIELRTNAERISTRTTLSALRKSRGENQSLVS
jgi:acetolactate synthase-1/2/3 large subunit